MFKRLATVVEQSNEDYMFFVARMILQPVLFQVTHIYEKSSTTLMSTHSGKTYIYWWAFTETTLNTRTYLSTNAMSIQNVGTNDR